MGKAKHIPVKAECHSDDQVCRCTFDAAKWFKQASDEDIIALAECGWRGDYPADEVAEYFERKDEDIRFMFKYIRARADLGFECVVDDADALEWLKANRPALAEKVAQIRARE